MEYLKLIKIICILGSARVTPKLYLGVGEFAQQVNGLATKDDDLGPIPGTNAVERDNQLLKFDLQKYIMAHVQAHTNNIHTQTDSNTYAHLK